MKITTRLSTAVPAEKLHLLFTAEHRHATTALQLKQAALHEKDRELTQTLERFLDDSLEVLGVLRQLYEDLKVEPARLDQLPEQEARLLKQISLIIQRDDERKAYLQDCVHAMGRAIHHQAERAAGLAVDLAHRPAAAASLNAISARKDRFVGLLLSSGETDGMAQDNRPSAHHAQDASTAQAAAS